MPELSQPSHRRVLVIDPAQSQIERIRNTLATPSATAEQPSMRYGSSGRPITQYSIQPIYYEIDTVADSEGAVRRVTAALENEAPFALALIDLHTFSTDVCIETLRRIWNADCEIQTILCVHQSEPESQNILDALGINDRLMVLREPYQDADLQLMALALTQKWRTARQLTTTLERRSEHIRDAARVVEIIYECERELADSRDDLQVQTARLSAQLKQRVDEILGTRDVMVFALERLAESRDAETGEHLERLRAYSQIIAEELAVTGPYTHEIGGDFLRNFALSTPLHDIGKVGVPDSILQKPSRLDVDEFDIMKQHTLIGAEALRAAAHQSIYGEFLLMAADIARSHHERFDGSGYPDGLVGTAIPLPARIVAVADVFDALTSRRVYKDAHAADEARKIIVSEAGKHFDPHVVQAFQRRYQDFLRVKNDNLSFGSSSATLATEVPGLA